MTYRGIPMIKPGRLYEGVMCLKMTAELVDHYYSQYLDVSIEL